MDIRKQTDPAKIGEIINKNILNALNKIQKTNQLFEEYETNCNKQINNYKNFGVDDIVKELEYCTDYFALLKAGDIIKCDCGSKEIPLSFNGTKVVCKEGSTSPIEVDIPAQIKEHKQGCFGTCLLEEPSRHPGGNAAGGNDCEPYIVGTSWLETYNNVKAEQLKTVLGKKSWLACKYMGRIMSADEIEDIDVTKMTEEEAFEEMLAWAQGKKYIPQVILDKITLIYAGGGQAVEDYWKQYPYKGSDYSVNLDKFDSKLIAWSKFANNLWDSEQADTHLEIRPVVLKAMCMTESSLGTHPDFNGTVNILQSLCIGDGGLWHLAGCNPYTNTFDADSKENILVWREDKDNESGNVTNGWVQFHEEDYFAKKTDADGSVSYERVFKSTQADYFGAADTGEIGNALFGEAIKRVSTNTDAGTLPDEMILVVYDQQSIDMSLCAAAIELANKGNEEKAAVTAYNGGGDSDYTKKVSKNLEDMGTAFIN